MAFPHAGRRDADQLRVAPERLQVRRPAVPHAGPQAALELVDHRRDAPLVRHAPLDALGHELPRGVVRGGRVEVLLEVAVRAAAPQRPDRTHPAVVLEAAALVEDEFARTLVGAGEQAAHHHRAGADRERLGDVAGVADAAVGDDRDVVLRRRGRALGHRGDHGHPDAGDDAGRADRSRPDADLDRVHARFGQRPRAARGRDVAGDEVHGRERPAQPGGGLDDVPRMSVGAVEHEHVHVGRDERLGPFERVLGDADGRADPQAAERVLARVGVLGGLLDVLDRDQAAQVELPVHHQELLDAVPVEDVLRLRQGRSDRHRDQVLARHHLGDGALDVAVEPQVAVGENPDQAPLVAAVLGDRHARDAVLLHQLERLADPRFGGERDRIDDHAALRALDAVDFGRLRRNVEVLVDDPDAAELGHGDRHPRLRHGVHGRAEERQVQRDAPRQARADVDVARQRGRMPRAEQHVVERQRGLDGGAGQPAGGRVDPDCHGDVPLTRRGTSCTSCRCRRDTAGCGRPSACPGGPS